METGLEHVFLIEELEMHILRSLLSIFNGLVIPLLFYSKRHTAAFWPIWCTFTNKWLQYSSFETICVSIVVYAIVESCKSFLFLFFFICDKLVKAMALHHTAPTFTFNPKSTYLYVKNNYVLIIKRLVNIVNFGFDTYKKKNWFKFKYFKKYLTLVPKKLWV